MFRGRVYKPRPWRPQGGRTILVLFAFVIAGTLAGAVISHADRQRRTAAAFANIEVARFQPGRGPYPHTPQGHWLYYTYAVRGASFRGAAFRPWTNLDLYDPKVCYDPARPADHLLVAGTVTCGS